MRQFLTTAPEDGELNRARAAAQWRPTPGLLTSAAMAHQLAAAGLVDEYRLLVMPFVVGSGMRLFPEGHRADLRLVSSEVVDAGLLLRYDVDRGV